ncbi:inactive beta-amylase 4, chloroplastic-like [Pyrus communis]|uniref:inactive beta-amylase 4, chloroplastic-like n=1 Tax=Pyrus communis TaxID=23211 RepID=UPI0035BF58C2
MFKLDARENSRSSILPSSRDKRIPIYVMMPVDAFCSDGTGRPRIRKIKALTVALRALKLACIHRIAVEVWWGIIERLSPLAYDWSLYEELFKLVSDSGWVTLSWLHARKENLSGKRRDHKRLAVATVSHLKFLSLERERKELYSGRLLHHADNILAKAIAYPVELAAGYYNTAVRDGYDHVASLLSHHGAVLYVP